MTVTKANIIEAVTDQNPFTRRQTKEIIETMLETIKHTLESGEDVLISGFGKFCVKDRKERLGRNPATGKDMLLPPRRVVTFKSSGQLREKINGS